MSAAISRGMKWQQIIAISIVCGFAVTGCDRSDKDDEVVEVDESEIDNSAVAPAVACDDPLVEDRLKRAIRSSLQQQAQSIAANYANNAGVSLNGGAISTKLNGIMIDITDTSISQGSNVNGMTTCQASVSATLKSEDLYQASQIYAANNMPSLQTRTGRANLGVSNNSLIDNNFSYMVGAKSGKVQVRINGQPELIAIVADVAVGSVLKTAIDNKRAQQSIRIEPTQTYDDNQANPQPQTVTPLESTRPAEAPKPVQPPTIRQNSNVTGNQNTNLRNNGASSVQGNNTQSNSANSVQGNNTQSSGASSIKGNSNLGTSPVVNNKPAATANDGGSDMVIIEDNNATY